MFSLILLFFLTMILSLILLLVGVLVSKKLAQESEKSSPFECGFSPKYKRRVPFSLRFYLIRVLFLIFDVELVLIFPLIISSARILNNNRILTIILFIILLIFGLVYEINTGSIN